MIPEKESIHLLRQDTQMNGMASNNFNWPNTIPELVTVSAVADAEAGDGPAGLVVQVAHVYDHSAVLDDFFCKGKSQIVQISKTDLKSLS